jgi:hypothetical protein
MFSGVIINGNIRVRRKFPVTITDTGNYYENYYKNDKKWANGAGRRRAGQNGATGQNGARRLISDVRNVCSPCPVIPNITQAVNAAL